MVAAALEAQGQADEALATLRQAAGLHPLDTALASELARTFIARGDLATAAEYLTVETAGDDPALLLTVADMQLRGDKVEEGLAIVRRLLEEDPARREQIAVLGWSVAEQKPEAGFTVVELAADAAVALADWPGAAAVLQEFVTRVPNHIPALMRLVEICVDGGLEATMYSAQGQLADAYIAAGAATEARFIAEDLVAREPWEKANIERFRRALVLLGRARSGRADRGAPERRVAVHEHRPVQHRGFRDAGAAAAGLRGGAGGRARRPCWRRRPRPNSRRRKSERKPVRRKHEEHHFELSSNAIDLDSILGDFDKPPRSHAASDDVEVDLSIDARRHQAPGVGARPEPRAAAGAVPRISTTSSASMRDQSRRSGLDDAEKEYKRGLALRKAGDIDGCIPALQKASRAPKLRFATAWLIARLYRDRAHDARGARVARARVAGAGVQHATTGIRSCTSWRRRSKSPARSRARSPSAWSSSPRRAATATWPSASIG